MIKGKELPPRVKKGITVMQHKQEQGNSQTNSMRSSNSTRRISMSRETGITLDKIY